MSATHNKHVAIQHNHSEAMQEYLCNSIALLPAPTLINIGRAGTKLKHNQEICIAHCSGFGQNP